MWKKLVLLGGVLAAGAAWVLSAPQAYDAAPLAAVQGDAGRGQAVYWAAGCASCHAGPQGDGAALSGGQAFATEFGTFYAPNISPDPVQGLGRWTLAEFGRAIQAGVSPDGAHYYPALPYAAYAKMSAQDLADLWAYLQTLPLDATPSRAHDLGFPFNIRRSLGLWKRLFLDDSYVLTGELTPVQTRGRYLAEALAHCGECHTPRGALGGLDRTRWLAGAPTPDGRARVPAIAGISWSDAELMTYFTTGFTPEFDSVGGHMAHVVDNLARLPETDRTALIAYLRALPPLQP
jgi:mono/diheme cytochrome c family protein